MHFSKLTLLSFVSVALANPVAEPQGGVLSIPGVNIPNGNLAGSSSVVKDSYIVVYKDGASDASVDKYEKKVTDKIGGGLKKKWRGAQGFAGAHVETDRKGLEAIAKDPLVAFVELDGIAKVAPIVVNTTTANNGASASKYVERKPSTWGLARISHRLKGFMNYIYDDGSCVGTRIYIVDTGIRTTHEQFRGEVIGAAGQRAKWGANFITGSPNVDEHGHGTHCAGTAAGWNYGVCRKATVIAVKVLDKDGSGPYSAIIAGLQWAAKDAIAKGFRSKSVISASLGGGYSAAVNSAVQGIINQGIPVVVAAGNEDQNAINVSPASSPNAITVGATDIDDTRAWFSNWGTTLDLFGPGVDIYSAYHLSNTNYAFLSGTSQATPHVAGLAAYLIAKEKIAGGITIRNRIVALSTKDKVIDRKGSYNRLAYNGSGR